MNKIQQAERDFILEYSFLTNEEYTDFPLKDKIYDYIFNKFDQYLGNHQKDIIKSINNIKSNLNIRNIDTDMLTPLNIKYAEEFIVQNSKFIDIYTIMNMMTSYINDSFLENLDTSPETGDPKFRMMMIKIIHIYFLGGINIPMFIQEYIMEEIPKIQYEINKSDSI